MTKKVNGKTVLTLPLWKALAIFFTALLGSAGAGLWGGIISATSDHFTVVALSNDVEEIKEEYARKDVEEVMWKNNEAQHSTIDTKLNTIIGLIEKIK